MQKEAGGLAHSHSKGDPGNLGGALMVCATLCLYQLGELVSYGTSCERLR